MCLSQKGWIRALKGHLEDTKSLQFKSGDNLKIAVKAWTTDKLVMFATNGKFFTLGADSLPGGRGHGEPLRLMVDLEGGHEIMQLFVHEPERKLLVASHSGNGFIVLEKDVVASTKKGKQILNVTSPDRAQLCIPADGDTIAVIGENRKFLVFSCDEINEMTRGRGVKLQRYKDGGLADARIFNESDGLTWEDTSGRKRTIIDFLEWRGARAQAGRMPPKGFPRSNKFGPAFEE